nr:hypothetical protein [uncultured Mucilaginibacter sp.]
MSFNFIGASSLYKSIPRCELPFFDFGIKDNPTPKYFAPTVALTWATFSRGSI